MSEPFDVEAAEVRAQKVTTGSMSLDWLEVEAPQTAEDVLRLAQMWREEKVEYAAAIERGMRATADLQAKLGEAQARIADLDLMLETAGDNGARLMLERLEAAITNGGKFSDERANAFVSARAEVARLRAETAEARATKDMHKERQEEAWAEVARLLEIKVYAEKAYEQLRADLTAKVERLEHELDDAKRSRDDAIGNAIRA